MKDYKDMTPEEVEEFLEYHKLELDIKEKHGVYYVLHGKTVINEFTRECNAYDFIVREKKEHRGHMLEMLKDEGDLRVE